MFESFKLAFNELYANKGRTILTALGISVGVMAVSLILSSGSIAQQYITGYLTKSIGKTTTVTINANFNSLADTATVNLPDLRFFESIKSKFPINSYSPLAITGTTVKNTLDESITQSVKGSGAQYQDIAGNKNLLNLNGRFFTQTEFDNAENVAVVTRQFSQEIKGKSSLLGDNLVLGNINFKVIGEFEGESSLTGGTKDIIMPSTSLWNLRGNNDRSFDQLLYSVETEEQLEFVSKQVLSELNNYRAATFSGDASKKLSTATSKSAIETISGVLIGFQLFLSLVAITSLVVGGIGVLNVMLMAVAQRIKEIGIRKAFGAKNRDILILFLSESVTLTALSGLFGAMIAQYLVYLGVTVANSINPDLGLVSVYSWSSIYVAFILSCVLGIIFGIYPAYKAGKLSVVDALRYD
jgi:putative ABC transport system permease protein